MFILLLLISLVSSINAASIVSRSQSYPLSQPAVLGPKTRITIGNKFITPDGFERSATLVNSIFPGPLIAAQKGDDFAIEVVNELKDESMFLSTSVHWHGLFENGTNYADGTSFVTQCPIAQNHSFYTLSLLRTRQAPSGIIVIIPSNMKCDGLRGPLVIYDLQDPLAYMYDVDNASTIITLSDWYHVVAPVLHNIIVLRPYSRGIGSKGLGLSSCAVPLTRVHALNFRMKSGWNPTKSKGLPEAGYSG
ncbi:Cupredoxin [Suillus subluteus]|nr:Cupredoxin [Suillus subluteus]